MSARVAVVWTPDFLRYNLGDGHPLDPVRLDLTMRLTTGLGVLEGVEPLVPAPASDEDVQRVHVPSYITAVKCAPEEPFGVGHGLGTEDNPIFSGMHEASALVCGGSLLAAREIAEGRADRAVNIAGGLHHAMPDRASGFCVYNDCAVAISWLLDHGFDRIAYIDVDVHHGDGVQAIFFADPRVLTISLHESGEYLFPGTGFVNEHGAGAAVGTAVNVPLPPGASDEAWLAAFRGIVPPLVRAFAPTVLVTQLGCDTHATDPLAHLRLTTRAYREAAAELHALAHESADGRWLATGGGGYRWADVVPRAWTIYFAEMCGADLDDALPGSWIESVEAEVRRAIPVTFGEPAVEDDRLDPETESTIALVRRTCFPYLGVEP
jgi:acetoin utilization protein AcuC